MSSGARRLTAGEQQGNWLLGRPTILAQALQALDVHQAIRSQVSSVGASKCTQNSVGQLLGRIVVGHCARRIAQEGIMAYSDEACQAAGLLFHTPCHIWQTHSTGRAVEEVKVHRVCSSHTSVSKLAWPLPSRATTGSCEADWQRSSTPDMTCTSGGRYATACVWIAVAIVSVAAGAYGTGSVSMARLSCEPIVLHCAVVNT